MIIVYIYDHQWNPLTQVFDVQRFECTQTLNSYDQSTFAFQSNHQDNSSVKLKNYNEIKITKIKNGIEYEYIHGIIHSVEATLTETVVKIRSFEWLFEKKIIASDKTYNNKTVDYIISELLWEINVRYETGISLDCAITDTIDLSIKKWATFSSVLQELVKLWYQYRVIQKKLCIKEHIWIDRTVWSWFYQLKWNSTDPLERNISKATISTDAWQLSNAPFEKSIWFQTDTVSINSYGRVEETITADGSPTVALHDTLTSKSSLIKIIDIDPKVKDFFAVNIWDLLSVDIHAGNDIMSYYGTVNVLQKTQDTRGVVKLLVSSSTVKVPSLLETIRNHEKSIKKLQNQ